MLFVRTILLVFCLFIAATVPAQVADSLKTTLDTALVILKTRSLYASRVNWDAAQAAAEADARGVQTRAELFEAIAGVYRKLEDRHGRFVHYDRQVKWGDSSAIRRYTPELLAEWAKGIRIKAEMIGATAYLRIPGMQVYNQQQVDRYANWLADSIASLAARQPRNWIIDLRLNSGGNIVPMMVPLAVFFREGILGYYLDGTGRPVAKSVVSNGRFYLEDTVSANLKTNGVKLTGTSVAVIVGPGTASSGEGVAAFFKDRKHTRLFGDSTAGFAEATEGFLFNDENSYFLLTTASLGNRGGKRLPHVVTPRVFVRHNDAFGNLEADAAIRAALQWLR